MPSWIRSLSSGLNLHVRTCSCYVRQRQALSNLRKGLGGEGVNVDRGDSQICFPIPSDSNIHIIFEHMNMAFSCQLCLSFVHVCNIFMSCWEGLYTIRSCSYITWKSTKYVPYVILFRLERTIFFTFSQWLQKVLW